METLVRKTLELEQYQCRKCSRFFYINKMDKSSLGMDFGCAFGCDDNGRHVRDLKAEIKEVKVITQKEDSGDKNESD
jgi:hypothetical protein